MATEPRDYYAISYPKHDVPTFDRDAFDDSIRDQGVTLVHYRAFKCPVGIRDQHDIRKGHEDHEGCSNGYVYKKAGELVGLFHSNSTGNRWMDSGLFTGSHVNLTVPTKYEDSDEAVMLKVADRLFLKEEQGLVVTDQLFTVNGSGLDKLRFPVSAVEHLMDNRGVEYTIHDFELSNGRLHWRSSHRPEPGSVCSIRYRYQPYWYVQELMHEVRVAQVLDPVTHERSIQRMPSAVRCARENVFENEQHDPQAQDPKSPRQVAGPDEDGLFGPR